MRIKHANTIGKSPYQHTSGEARPQSTTSPVPFGEQRDIYQRAKSTKALDQTDTSQNTKSFAQIRPNRPLDVVLRQQQPYPPKRPTTSHAQDIYIGSAPVQQHQGAYRNLQSAQRKDQTLKDKIIPYQKPVNRRENITQVIKDCFITKSCQPTPMKQ